MSYVLEDEFEAISVKISNKLLTSLNEVNNTITGVHFLDGHPLEIIETLAQRDKSQTFKFKKYPLIALFQDYNKISNGIDYDFEADLHFIIANSTKPTYKAKERRENNFKPILWPIYDELLYQISVSPVFVESVIQEIEKDKIDRYYWGRQGLFGNEKNIFNDWIDCVELKMKLKVNFKNC